MTAAIAADPEARVLWDEFQHLAAERQHKLSPDMLTRPATIPQLKALIGFLSRQPVRNVAEPSLSSGSAHQRKPVSKDLIPAGRYAIKSLSGNNDLDFYELKNGRKGSKWETFLFIEQIVGGHENFPVKNHDRKSEILKAIRQMGIDASRLLAAQELKICMDCHSPLTDEESRRRGKGPVCAAK